VAIGKGCFIGARAIILKGVTIGDGAVVAAGALVTRDVPAEHLAIGNPAMVKPLDERWLHR
jgi:acetyltransferase-like isoleucine patch superfamily enzyme